MLVSESLRKFNEVHWQQPGFLGSLSVEIDHGEAVIVNFWSDRQSAEAALPRMVPVVERLWSRYSQASPSFLEAAE